MSIFTIDPSTFDGLVLSHVATIIFAAWLLGLYSLGKQGTAQEQPTAFRWWRGLFLHRETALGQFGALDRKAIIDANLSLMMAEGPSVVADLAFTSGKIAQVNSETQLQITRAKVGT